MRLLSPRPPCSQQPQANKLPPSLISSAALPHQPLGGSGGSHLQPRQAPKICEVVTHGEIPCAGTSVP